MGKNLMIMLPFTQYLRFLRAPKFTRGYWPRVIFGALRIVKNRVILVFIIATLPAKLLKILFTRFLTAFYTPLFVCFVWWLKFHYLFKFWNRSTVILILIMVTHIGSLFLCNFGIHFVRGKKVTYSGFFVICTLWR